MHSIHTKTWLPEGEGVRPSNVVSLALFVLLVCSGTKLAAHGLGEGYIFLSVYEDRLEGRIEAPLSDLNEGVPMDENNDTVVSQAEFENAANAVRTYMAAGISLGQSDRTYAIKYTTHEVFKIPQAQYAVLNFVIDDLETVPSVLEVGYELLFAVNPDHRGFLIIEFNHFTGMTNTTEAVSLVFSPESVRQSIDLTKTHHIYEVAAVVGQGVWQAWAGLYSLFLMTLLLPATGKWQGPAWAPASSFKPTLAYALTVFLLFLVGHSFTYYLGVLGTVPLSPRWVDLILVASILFVGTHNLYPFMKDKISRLILPMGLLYGLGMALQFEGLGAQPAIWTQSLCAFHLGLEAGLVVVVSVVLAILHEVRNKTFYTTVILKLGSLALAAMAVAWFLNQHVL